MTDINITRFLGYRKYNQVGLMIVGCSPKNSKITSTVVPLFYLSISFSTVFFLSRFVRLHYTNLPVLIYCLSIILASLIVALKVITLIVHRKKFHELQNILDTYFNDLLQKNDMLDILLNKINIYRSLTWCLSIALLIVSCTYISMPMIKIIQNHIHHIEPTRPILLYPTSYPWTVPKTGYFYFCHLLFELSVNISVFIITISLDSLFLFYTFLMIGQLREISYCITHIDDKKNPAEAAIKKCAVQYATLLKCKNILEKIYGVIILAMILSNALVLCTLIYQLTQMKTISILKGANFFAYIITKLVQTYTYSWCGTNLTNESEKYRNAIYSSNWYGDKRLTKAVIIMLKQKPLVLSACNFSDVSIDIFSKILNTTISYYFLLKTLA